MKIIRLQTLALLVSATLCHAQEGPAFTGPGWFRSIDKSPSTVQAAQWSGEREPSQGSGSGGGAGTMSLVSFPEIAEAVTPEIQALARGLENDPEQIFYFVRDHIRYVHYFGSKKGAQLTLLERSGNDFDQCALLVALLRAAGHTASYRFGTVYMPYEEVDQRDFKHWLGLSKPNTNWVETKSFVLGLNDYRGFPFPLGTFIGDENDLVFHRVWVRLTLGESTYSLDPAFKVHEPIAGIDLTSAMGWNSNAVWTAAGGTSTADYVLNMSEANLRNKLRDFTTNLLAYLQANHPNASVEEVLGGQSIQSGQSFTGSLPFTPYDWELSAQALNWDYIPTNLMTTLQISVDSTNLLLFTPQLQGQRLSLTFSTGGLGQLWLDDELLLEKQTSGGSTVNVGLSVDHPHGIWDFTNNTLINLGWNDHSVTNTYQRTNASYAIAYAFEPDQDWLRQRQERLDQHRQQGLADTSREVTTETLNIMGLNWMLQTERIPRVLAAQQEILLQQHHRLGRMAQEFGRGYYIDVYQQLSGLYAASGNSSGDIARSDRVFDLENYFASAAEHGLIEQLQSSNLVAASTVKMLQIGNTNGQRTYLAKSSNWSTVQGFLSNYDKTWLKTNYIDRGFSLLLPANGSNVLAGAGSWAGYGLVARGVITNAQGVFKDMVMLIKGGYHGGYVAYPDSVLDPVFIYEQSYSQPLYFDPVPLLVGTPFGADPVNMADGSFHLSATDLSLGQAEPRGISFTRHYNSNRRRHNLAGMAQGWVHSYHSKAADMSAPLAALGDTTPAQMAALIVATRSAFEFYRPNGVPKNWAVSSIMAKWGVDQLINNAVSISLGKDTIQFVKQPNGDFTPPAGSTMTLLKTNGAYWLRERHGNTFKFSGGGLLTNIVDQYNQKLAITHNSSNWVATVKDWKNRQLTLTYSGTPSRLTSISDNTTPTRTVSYGYTTAGGQTDLTSVTDAESKTSTFLYDTNHQIVATKDALGRVVVSNAYDGFGRVIEQYSQGDTNKTWQLFWSGFRNTEQDPNGGRTHYFYDDKHRLIHTQDSLGHWTDRYYDGQDHLETVFTHLFNRTDYYYDGRHNLTDIQDPLNYWKTFYYDSQDNMVRVLDERDHNSYFAYNAKFQLTASTNNAGDWVTYAYNATDGTQTSRTDPGGTTTFGYDTYGQLDSVTHPGGLGSESYQNNARGDRSSRTNPRGFATTYQYNKRRELTATVGPTNLTSQIAYDDASNVQSSTDARGFVSSNTWSATRKLLTATLPPTPQGMPVSSHLYDSRDWLWRTLDPLQQPTTYTNDAAQRLIGVADSLSRTNTFVYDEDNRRIYAANAAGEATWQFWNDRNELVFVITPQSTYIDHVYDGVGNRVSLTNRNNKSWQFQFDAANRATNTVSPLGRSIVQTWNNRGLLATVKEPSGQTTTLTYDAKGRMSSRADSLATATYGHDANDNVTSVVEAGRTNLWTFDAYDRVTSYKDAEGNLIQYRHDQNGNVTNLVYPSGKNVYYAFDSLNRLTNVTDWANRKTSIEYDLASRVRKITRPNGTVREMNYDAAGQMTNILERTAGGAPISLFKLNWNNAARVEWEFAAPLPQPYTPPSRVMTYNDDNQVATFNGQSVTHDLDGNMTYGPGTNNTFLTYTYDPRNRLISAGGMTYAYDSGGNRVAITNASAVTRFVVNPNAALSQVLVRTKPDGSKTFYVYGVGLLYEVNETSGGTEAGTATYHYDYRGSTVALTDGTGNVTDRIGYSAYGLTAFRTGTTDTPFLFNGRFGVQTDPNGLLYMRARYYNPYLCRFLNPDPVGFAGGLNWYAYADGNPISMVDPFGLSPWTRIGGGLRAIGGALEAAAGYSLAVASGTAAVGTSPTVVGAVGFGALAVGGAAVGAHGVDQFQAGIRQLWTGEHVDSLTSGALQSAGMSQNTANLTDAGISVVGSFGAGFGATAIRVTELSGTSISAQVANAPLLTRIGYYEVGQLSLADDAYTYYSLWGNTIDRGAAMVADQGWIAAMRQGSLTLGLRQGTLFTTGLPTPLGSGLGGAAGGFVNWLGQPFSTGGK